MELKVIKDFRDKHTKEIHLKDEVLNVTDERGEELLRSPYVVVVKEVTKQDETEKTDKLNKTKNKAEK